MTTKADVIFAIIQLMIIVIGIFFVYKSLEMAYITTKNNAFCKQVYPPMIDNYINYYQSDNNKDKIICCRHTLRDNILLKECDTFKMEK